MSRPKSQQHYVKFCRVSIVSGRLIMQEGREAPAVTKPKEGTKLLTISEAAGQLGVSAGTLRAWADKGLIKTIRLPSGYRRFTQQEIDHRRREMGLEDEA